MREFLTSTNVRSQTRNGAANFRMDSLLAEANGISGQQSFQHLGARPKTSSRSNHTAENWSQDFARAQTEQSFEDAWSKEVSFAQNPNHRSVLATSSNWAEEYLKEDALPVLNAPKSDLETVGDQLFGKTDNKRSPIDLKPLLNQFSKAQLT